MQLDKKKINIGFLLLLMWCIVSAFSRIYTGDIEQKLNPVVLGFYISFIAVCFFVLISFKNSEKIIAKACKNYKNIIGINVTTVGCWLFLMYPLKFLEPSIVSAMALCVAPGATLMVSRFIYKEQQNRKYDYLISTALLMMAFYLIAIDFLDKTAIKHIVVTHNILAILCCFVVGISLAFNNIYAKRLSNANFSPVETLTLRFILMLFCAGLISLFIKQQIVFDCNLAGGILLASFSLIIIPQLALQRAICALQPVSIAIVLPLMPVLVFFLEYYDARLQPTLYSIVGISIILFITLTGLMLRYNAERRDPFK